MGWRLFILLFVTYAYFYQGGGWHQNSRFDQVRAMAEQRRFAINDYLFYQVERAADGTRTLRRLPLPTEDTSRIGQVANTGDVAKHEPTGRFFPNKPPGGALLALPAHAVVHASQSALGVDPDTWWALTVSHYLATAFSVALLGAWAGVLFHDCARRLFPAAAPRSWLGATLTFALGTLMLPFSTLLFDNVPTATLLLASFWALLRQTEATTQRQGNLWLLAAGFAGGVAVLVHYTAAPIVALLGLYAFRRLEERAPLIWWVAGGVPSLVLLLIYHALCFGSPFAVANAMQAEMFVTDGAVLGVLRLPSFDVAWRLLVGSRRGLFITSPVLFAAVAGWVFMVRARRRRAEAILFVTIFVTLWLINASFNGWHAGFTIGPRYLLPALPFLALPLVAALERARVATLVLAAISAAMLLLATAVDVQPPLFLENPMLDYVVPLFRGETVEIEAVAIEGPVSANPIGSYEPWYYTRYDRGSPETRWNSFNLGELLFPRSRLSLLPLLLWLGLGVGWLYREAGQDAYRM